MTHPSIARSATDEQVDEVLRAVRRGSDYLRARLDR